VVSKTPTPAAGGAATVLVVEDEPSLAMLESEMLERAGFKVEQVTLGRSALRVLDSHDVAVVVTDYTMPDMTGADFMAALRQRSAVPVIAVTGHSDPEVEQQMRAAGVFEFLFKDPGLKFLRELPKAVAAAIAQA
jgi:two-component system capsular synthesis sensor histidine kinase RcsC